MIPTLDTYSLRARWVPAATSLLALVLAIASWLPTLQASLLGAGVLLAIVAPTAAHLARDKGKALEAALWANWGGPPTTQVLRHGNPHLPADRVALYHRQIAALFPDALLPTVEGQSTDKDASDAVWATVTKRLIARTRDKVQFGLLFAENCSYGCWWQLLALRPFAIWTSCSAIGVAMARIGFRLGSGKGVDEVAVAAAMTAAIAVYFFTRVVSERLVWTAAFAYAERLMEATEMLPLVKEK